MKSNEIITKYLDKSKYDLCCSESIFYAANEYYDLKLDSNTFKVSAAFCGGNIVEGNCGLLTASISILAIMFATDVSHKSETMREYIVEYTELFKSEFSDINCANLKLKYRTEEEGCRLLIVAAFIHFVNYVNSKL